MTIKATGDFARTTGIGSYTVQRATTSNTSAENVYLSQGAADALTGDETILSGTIKVGSGAEINTAGKTLNQIISEINSQGNVTASITDGKFTIESETSGVSIQATGDMARVTGLASYTTQSGTTTNVASENPNFVKPVIRLTESEALAQDYTVIKTAADLDNIRNNLNGKYILMNDIDLSSYSDWNPIGDDYTKIFSGILDGNGFVIKNLNISNTNSRWAGLFGYTESATIKNLGLENINVSTIYSGFVGGLTGNDENSTISNCYVSGVINLTDRSQDYVGGLVGYSYGTQIMDCSACIDITTMDAVNVGGLVGYCVNSNLTNCSSEGNIEVSGNHTFIDETVGGLVGYGGIITSCCSSVNIKGEADYAGGLVGVNSTIKNSYANGNITLEKGRVGGLAGMCGTVENSYATGNIESLGEVGGLIGDIEDGGSIINCYATGSVSSGFESSFGGLFGNVDFANIINCYSTGKVIKIDDSSFYNLGGFGGDNNNHDISGCFWDMEKSGQSFAFHNENLADDELKGLSTSDFSNPDTFINAGWDEDVWDFSGSTPTLKVEMFLKENTDSSTLTGSVNTNGMTQVCLQLSVLTER